MTGQPPDSSMPARTPKSAAPRKPRTKGARSPNPTTTPAPQNVTLIVGTDTGVGKTWVTCAVARALIAAGQQVIAIKPVETGDPISGNPDDEDGTLLAVATGQAEPRRALIRLKSPVAPAIAADLEGITIDTDELVTRIRAFSANRSITLVETAGGVLAPLTWHDNALDLAHKLNARALLVAVDRLGTINHTLLTLHRLKADRVPVVGVVLTAPEVPDESTRSNAAAIARLSGMDLVWPVPRLADPMQAAEALKEVAGWLLP
ncbi:MAG: dethiobiotin synthase [Gemmatimonadota bacterium]